MLREESLENRFRRSSLVTTSSTRYSVASPSSHASRLRSPPKVLSTVIFKDGSNKQPDDFHIPHNVHYDLDSKPSPLYSFTELRAMSTESPGRRTKERLYMPCPEQDHNATFTVASTHKPSFSQSRSKVRGKSRVEFCGHKRTSSKRKSFSRMLKSVPTWKKDLKQLLTQVAEHMDHCSGFRDRVVSKRIPLLEAFQKFNL